MRKTTVLGSALVGISGMAGAVAAGPIGAGIAAGFASAVYAGLRDANRRMKASSHIDRISEDPESTQIGNEPSIEHRE